MNSRRETWLPGRIMRPSVSLDATSPRRKCAVDALASQPTCPQRSLVDTVLCIQYAPFLLPAPWLGCGLGVALVWPWCGLGVALGWPWGGFGVALGWPWCGLGVPMRCLCGAYAVPINRLWGGFGVALRWLWVALLGFSAFCLLPFASGRLGATLPGFSRFEVRGSKFSVFHKHTESNSPPVSPSGWSGGALDIPWTYPIPIDPPRTPVFDQPGLSKPLSGGVNIAESSSKSDVQPPGAAFCTTCCGTVGCVFQIKTAVRALMVCHRPLYQYKRYLASKYQLTILPLLPVSVTRDRRET
jgi:hypothetical protein